MTGLFKLDLTEAVAAGKKVTTDYIARKSDDVPNEENIVRAAAPAIEAAVRKQIADELTRLIDAGTAFARDFGQDEPFTVKGLKIARSVALQDGGDEDDDERL